MNNARISLLEQFILLLEQCILLLEQCILFAEPLVVFRILDARVVVLRIVRDEARTGEHANAEEDVRRAEQERQAA